MKTFVSTGNVVDLVAPYDTLAGQGVLVGQLLGVATSDGLTGATILCIVDGIVTLKKTGTLAISIGDPVYWDDTAREVNDTSTAQKEVGIAVTATGAGAGETSINVLLVPSIRTSVAA